MRASWPSSTVAIAALLGILVAGTGCGKQEERSEVLSAQFQVFAADGTELRMASLTPESPVKLAEGEYVMHELEKYQARAGGGELRISNGRIKTKNIAINKP